MNQKLFSYFMSDGPGSLLKYGGLSLEQSLLIEGHLDSGGSALSSIRSQLSVFWTSVSLRENQNQNQSVYLKPFQV